MFVADNDRDFEFTLSSPIPYLVDHDGDVHSSALRRLIKYNCVEKYSVIGLRQKDSL